MFRALRIWRYLTACVRGGRACCSGGQRDARAAACAAGSHSRLHPIPCMHRVAVEVYGEATAYPLVHLLFFSYSFFQSFVVFSSFSAGVSEAQRAGAAGAWLLRALVLMVFCLWAHVQRLPYDMLQLCKVCSDNAINVVLVPCGHMCLCGVCAGKHWFVCVSVCVFVFVCGCVFR